MRGSFSTERLGVDLGRLRSTSNGQANVLHWPTTQATRQFLHINFSIGEWPDHSPIDMATLNIIVITS
jgi:hypothetical protein